MAEDAELEHEPEREEIIPGVARALSPLVRRIRATNPSPHSGDGTNTYLVGIDEIVVIDPGPEDSSHLASITGCGGDRIRWIVCTSADPEHSGGSAALKEATGAVVLASTALDGVAVDGDLGDGETLVGTEFRLTAHHTPGTSPEHLALVLPEERLLFSGDLIVEGSSMPVVAPTGDMNAYLASLDAIRKLRLQRIAPAHGHIIENPAEAIDEYLQHRAEREAQILAALDNGSSTVDDLVESIYGTLDEGSRELAAGTVLAHLQKLSGDKRVRRRKAVWSAA